MSKKDKEPKCPFRGIFPKKPIDTPIESETINGLKIFRLHPGGCIVRKADSQLGGDMHKEPDTQNALKWCGPIIHANKLGYWVFPPVDMDITYLGGDKWERNIIRDYAPSEKFVIEGNLRPEDKFRDSERMKTAFSLSEPATVQLWTGCVFRTPPGWCLHVRNPINFPEAYNRPYHIQEGIIESDWMNYDIWLNIKFHRIGEKVEIRRDQWPPIAQIVPVRRSSYEGEWPKTDKMLSVEDPEGLEVWEGWQEYNYKKWKANGEKDTRTYHKARKPNIQEMKDKGLIP